MTRTIGTLDRLRWIAALTAASLAVCVAAAVAVQHGQFPGLGATTGSVSPAPAGSTAPLDPRIAAIADHHPGQIVQTIVQFKAGVAPQRARWDVARAAGQVFGELRIINALAVKLPAERARWLAANRDVHAVSLNATVQTEGGPAPLGAPAAAPPAAPALGAGPRGHDDRRRLADNLQTTYDQTLGVTGLWRAGIDGSGVGVAVIDTGIDGNLVDFQGAGGRSRVVETAVTNPNAQNVMDDYGHGTDVAGIIAGDGLQRAPSDPLYGQYIGVAPNANLISIKASDDSGHATVLDVIYGLQFAVDHRADYNIRVVNLSLDSTTPQSYKTDPLDAAVEAAWMHGIVVVAAAGNRGDAADAVQYAPANDPYAITVGAVDENGSSNPLDDTIASWSSRGTTQDGFQKPDVYAPGAHIISVLAPDSTFARLCPTCIVGGAYIRTSGTSMATPMISGLVADLLQLHPDWSPDQVKGALLDPAARSNPSIAEVDALRLTIQPNPPLADQGLTPNELIDPATGGVDYSQSSWSQSSWSQATGPLSASFAQSSWSCSCIQAAGTGAVGTSTSSWSTSSWSTSSWSTYWG
jgi:serine protease AprX